MEWYVYRHDINSDKIEPYNIFNHGGFSKDFKQAAKNCPKKIEFASELKASLQYYFWSKSEWEILLSPWVGSAKNKPVKIDVYQQVMDNWRAFLEYCWDRRW